MTKFEFLNRTIELEIAGEKFVLTYGDDLAWRVQECMRDSAKLLEEVRAGRKGEDDVTPFLRDTIDKVLESDGACDRIFKGREPNAIEASDVVWYITGEVRKKREELEASPTYQAMKAETESGVLETAKAAIAGMSKPNRAARRVTAKKK